MVLYRMWYIYRMSDRHSRASKARWDSIPAEERSRLMSPKAVKRWADKTPRQRRLHALKMVRARKSK